MNNQTHDVGPVRARVLVVDDDHELRGLLQDILRGADYSVITAADGREALKCLESQAIDLVLTDLVMPDLDGTELIRMIRTRWEAIPVIAVSGSWRGSGLYLRIAEKLGAAALLGKPFRMKQVLDTVSSCLRGEASH